jgi:HAD superfamily hydrolase (TIGR01509 family)
MRIEGVMFDWDGVLFDSLGASFNVYNRIFARVGVKPLTFDEFLGLQSPNSHEFYLNVGVSEKLWKEVDNDWNRLYREERPDLHPDARECLDALKRSRFKLALVSNGSWTRVERELRSLGLDVFFVSILCGSEEELKPSPVMLEKTLNVLNLRPQSAVYVGDAPADIQAARKAGVISIAIARGLIQAERLRKENPDHVFGGLEEMTSFLIKH